MSYVYAEERSKLFTDDGQKLFLKIRDATKYLLKEAGAVRLGTLISNQKFAITGDSWEMLACVDRLVELGEIVEIPNTTSTYGYGQDRIFVKAPIDY